MTTVLVLPENIFNIGVYSRSTWFHFELNLFKFSGFFEKNPSENFEKFSSSANHGGLLFFKPCPPTILVLLRV